MSVVVYNEDFFMKYTVILSNQHIAVLKKLDALDKYMDNMRSQREMISRWYSSIFKRKELSDGTVIRTFDMSKSSFFDIINVIQWDKTPEGHDYWAVLLETAKEILKTDYGKGYL